MTERKAVWIVYDFSEIIWLFGCSLTPARRAAHREEPTAPES